MNPAARDGWIDIARGLAAASVVLFHFNAVIEHGGGGLWRQVWSYGHLGVPVFFVLSGWCITLSWLRGGSAFAFGTRRLRRLYPPYLASWILVLAVAAGTKLLSGVNDVARAPGTALAWLANLTLVTDPASPVPAINWVYWSLSYEVAFYALLAGLLFAPSRAQVALLALLHVALCLAAAMELPTQATPFFFVRYWPLFGLGAALALRRAHSPWALLMLGACALPVVRLLVAPSAYIGAAYLTVAIATALLLSVIPRIGLPQWLRPLGYLGTISYSLYLIHVPVGVFGFLRLITPQPENPAALAGLQLLCLAAVVAVAALFHRAIERPFLNPPVASLPSPRPLGAAS